MSILAVGYLILFLNVPPSPNLPYENCHPSFKNSEHSSTWQILIFSLEQLIIPQYACIYEMGKMERLGENLRNKVENRNKNK